MQNTLHPFVDILKINSNAQWHKTTGVLHAGTKIGNVCIVLLHSSLKNQGVHSVTFNLTINFSKKYRFQICVC